MTSEDTLAVIRSQITHSTPVADLNARADGIDARADTIQALVNVLTGRADANDVDVDALQTWGAGVATQLISIAASLAAVPAFRLKTVSLGSMNAGANDTVILWTLPFADAAYGVSALIEGSTTAISNLTPGVKASSRTTVGCTITVMNSGLLPVAAGAQLHVLGWHT